MSTNLPQVRRVPASAIVSLRQGTARSIALLGRQAAARPRVGQLAGASARWIGRREHRIISGPAAGYRIRLDHASKLGFLLGSSEWRTQALLAHALTQGDTFYDVGANVGFLTLVGARALGPTGQVVAFEPSSRNAATLRHNVPLKRLWWVEIVEAAVGDGPRTVTFAAGDSDQTGHLVTDAAGGTTVAVVSIDAWLSTGRRPPDVVKIDVEGGEQAILDGALTLLTKYRPIVICEVHAVAPRLADHQVSRFFRDLDYSTEWLDQPDEHRSNSWAPHLVARRATSPTYQPAH